ncbi:zinc finger MYND domain-containing protein 15-like [Gigantopelta aegis]|uniref:zinc finger MYND domain-containing protein 15-like n=1 Tax=Gigantopelta aegis TaxID=1735272 RepID=UPI001B88A87C|nr:zinc finger MYND domain-containing protein 15-like [Gigantopelta aegis]
MDGTKKSKEEIDAYVDELFKQNPDKFAELAVDIQDKMAQSVGQEEKIRALPMEDTIWFIVELETVVDDDGVTHRYVQMNDKRGMGLGVNVADPSNKTLSQQAYNLFCYCCLFPVAKSPRRPRIVTYQDKTKLQSAAILDLSTVGVYFMSPGLGPPLSMSELWFRQCNMCPMKGTPDLFKKCSSCDAIIYCSKECQKRGWSQPGDMKNHSHKRWCARMKQYMTRTTELADFPFSYVQETTSLDFHVLAYRKFLKKHGVYNKGMWRRECLLWAQQGNDIPFGDLTDDDNPFVLPTEGAVLSTKPDSVPPDMSKPFTDWTQYYTFRGFSLDSPIAALLSFPLTLYYLVTSCFKTDYPDRLKTGDTFVIHLVGAEKEVEMLAAFQEFARLLPTMKFQIDMVGNEISKSVKKGRQLENIKMTCYKGWYHTQKLDKPDLVVGFNAGIGAYVTWGETLKKLKMDSTPVYLTDYCQLSCECAREAMEGLGVGSTTEPIINPFRSPLRKVCEENNMPWYSNAFIYRLIYS